MVLPSVHEHEGPGVIYAGSQHFSSYHLLTGLQVRAAHAPRLKAGSNKGVIDSTEGLLWVAFKERERGDPRARRTCFGDFVEGSAASSVRERGERERRGKF